MAFSIFGRVFVVTVYIFRVYLLIFYAIFCQMRTIILYTPGRIAAVKTRVDKSLARETLN